MKTILRSAVAVAALMSITGVAHAQTAQLHYAAVTPIPGVGLTLTNPSGIGGAILAGIAELAIANGIGTKYTAFADAPGNTETATPRVDVSFKLTGTVQKDCSFYAGNNANATNIDFGVIGVRTGNNENVNAAFDMVGPAVAAINSLTAGCNFNNLVTVQKTNGAAGMKNNASGGYDSNQFQANLPYEVNASWTGTTNQSGPQAGSPQTLNVSTSEGIDQLAQGAWRSDMDINVLVPVATNALVAGNYEDTMILTLQAL